MRTFSEQETVRREKLEEIRKKVKDTKKNNK